MDQLIKLVEATQAVTDFPEIRPGDTVKIQLKVIEGEKERLQAFEGVVISDRGAGGNKTITVRKISHGVGVRDDLDLADYHRLNRRSDSQHP